MHPQVIVYAGEGAAADFLPGRRLNAAEVLETDWDSSCDLFIMPGGRDRPYHAALQGLGNQKIRSFVEKGGAYLGLCAGAYYGCARVAFDEGCPLEVSEERELQFFSGTAEGPAYGKGTFDYTSNRGVRAALLETGLGKFHAHYNGGCMFTGDLSECEVLARFLDLEGEPPAVIRCRVGKGVAILSGVHIEIPACSLDAKDPFLSPLIPQLHASEAARVRFWDFILAGVR